MSSAMYLTKSLFQRSIECSRKLIYNMMLHKQRQQQKQQQQQQSLSVPELLKAPIAPTSFLQHLAADGYRMNRYVQSIFDRNGGAILIDSKDTDDAIQQTEQILLGSQSTNNTTPTCTSTTTTTIYEAAIRWKSCLIRTDILQIIHPATTTNQSDQQQSPMLKLCEVKAKSWDSSMYPTANNKSDDNTTVIGIDNHPMMTKNGTVIKAEYSTILYDIAYQYYILSQAYPQYTIASCSFILPDKSKINTSTPGLYTMFDDMCDDDDDNNNKKNKEQQQINRDLLLDSNEILYTEVDVTSIIPYILHQPFIYPGCDNMDQQQLQPKTFQQVIHDWNDVMERYNNNNNTINNEEVETVGNNSYYDPNDQIMNQFISQIYNDNNDTHTSSSSSTTAATIAAPIGGHCKSCEFRNKTTTATAGSTRQDCKSGFEYCWGPVLAADSVIRNSHINNDLLKNHIEVVVAPSPQLVIDLYYGGKVVTDMLKQNKYLLSDITKKDLKLEAAVVEVEVDDSKKKKSKKKIKTVGMSRKERQWYHVQSTLSTNDPENNVILDKDYLHKVLEEYEYPYHFIDFETIAPIFPFTVNKHPYEPIAFQFSHHTLHEDGITTHHATEFIHTTPGVCPNIYFLNALCDTFQNRYTDGTIFRWGAHENTILRSIYASCVVQSFDIERPTRKSMERFFGTGFSDDDDNSNIIASSDVGIVQDGMIDLMNIILKGYYVNGSKGSASIKSLLLPTLQYSTHLRDIYEAPTYSSSNFKNMQWWMEANPGSGIPIDPYKLLQTVDGNDSDNTRSSSSVVSHGGDAIAAYSILQGNGIDANVRKDVEKSLLRYCELDTLAMVMIMQSLLGYLK